MKTRLWLERLGIALITVVALGAPLLMGVVGYLVISDGIDWGVGDPLREGRMFILREPRGLAGIGIVRKSPASDASGTLNCARTHYTELRWSPSLGIDGNANTCTCYAMQDGRLRDTKTACR